jgi:hypothetical protein
VRDAIPMTVLATSEPRDSFSLLDIDPPGLIRGLPALRTVSGIIGPTSLVRVVNG